MTGMLQSRLEETAMTANPNEKVWKFEVFGGKNKDPKELGYRLTFVLANNRKRAYAQVKEDIKGFRWCYYSYHHSKPEIVSHGQVPRSEFVLDDIGRKTWTPSFVPFPNKG
jgi:hypothetical protein